MPPVRYTEARSRSIADQRKRLEKQEELKKKLNGQPEQGQNQPSPSPSRPDIPSSREYASPLPSYNNPLNTLPTGQQALQQIQEMRMIREDPGGYAVRKAVKIGGLVAFGVNPAGAVVGAGLGVGIGEGVSYATTGKPLTPQEAEDAAYGGAAFSVGTSFLYQGIGKVAPAAMKGAAGVGTRLSVSTGIGAGANYALSGGDAEAAKQGALFGLGFGVVGEGIRYGVQRARGFKVRRAVGASEIERNTATENVVSSERLTQLKTENERVPYKYGKFIKENQRFFTPDEVELGGKERVIQTGGGEYDVYERAALASRKAEPYLNAAQGKSSLSVEGVGVGDVAGERISMTSSKAPGQVFQKTTIAGGNYLGPEKILSQRTFSTVQFFGDIDRQVYLNYLKNVPKGVGQSWLMQMGGLSYEQIQQTPTKLRVFTNVVSVEPSIPHVAPIIPIVTVNRVAQPSSKQPAQFQTKTPEAPQRLTRKDPLTNLKIRPIQRQPISQNIFPESKQSPEYTPYVSQRPIQRASQTTETTQAAETAFKTPSPPHRQNVTFPMDFKFEGQGVDIPPILRFRGVKSRKRKYPILSGEDVLKI